MLYEVITIVRKSDYLVEMLGMPYHQLSRIFSKYRAITIEKHLINLKIARIKELIAEGEYTLSEIAYMMDYSSVQHLSMQFKKIVITSYSIHYTKLYDPEKSSSKRDPRMVTLSPCRPSILRVPPI